MPGELVTPFISPEWNPYARGTGAFVYGDPAHFLLDIGDGTYLIPLEKGDFCEDLSPPP